MDLRFVQKSMTLNDLERLERKCSHRSPKSNLLRAQRSARVGFTNLLFLSSSLRVTTPLSGTSYSFDAE